MAFRAVAMLRRSALGAAAPALRAAAPAAPTQAVTRAVSKYAPRYSVAADAAVSAAGPEKYGGGMQLFHWAVGGSILGAFATVQLAMNEKPGKNKGYWMTMHKSFGLLAAGLGAPRVAMRLASKVPPPPPGSMLEHLAATVVHGGLYVMMLGMAATGVSMGYYGGRGLPFFWTSFPGVAKPGSPEHLPEHKKIAGQAFKIHKTMGQVFEYTTALHVGAVGFHAVRGQKVLQRMLPFGSTA